MPIEATSGRILGEKTAVLVMQVLLEALADPFTEVTFDRHPKDVCPLCGSDVRRPTKHSPIFKCRNQVSIDQRCDWTGKEPVREVRLEINAVTRGK